MHSARRSVVLAISAALALPFAAAQAARADVYTSTGPSLSGEWSDPGTWVNQSTAGSGVPGASDTAVITTGHFLSLTADAPVTKLTVQPGANLNLSSRTLTASGEVELLGGYDTPSGLSSGTLDAGGLTVENTSVAGADITTTGALVFSGPVGADSAVESVWANSTLTQTGGTAAFNGHTISGGLSPELDDVALTVTGLNDFGSGQLTLGGTGAAAFKPVDPTPLLGKPLLKLGSLVVTGTQTATVDWTAFSGADTDVADLVTVDSGSTSGLDATDGPDVTFTRPNLGATLRATYVGDPKPFPTVQPSVSVNSTLAGHGLPGQTVTCAPGSWTPDGTKTYEWTRGGDAVAGLSMDTYVIDDLDAGLDIACTVTATSPQNKAGSATSTNVIHVDAIPLNITEPQVKKGASAATTAVAGDTLTCDPGLWTADAPAYTYAWKRDATTVGAAATYTVVSEDTGHAITCEVAATDGLATSDPTASPSGPTVLAPPAATVKPSVASARTPSTRATTGDVLTCSPGSWTPDGAKTYSWKRNATPVDGATAATYTVTGEDVGKVISCSVTVTAGTLSTTEDSNAVTPLATPVNTAAPSISGTASPGETLTCDPGSWSVSASFAFTWTRDGNEVGSDATYKVTTDDTGTQLRCAVVATAEGFTGAAESAPVTGQATPPAPTLSISGVPDRVMEHQLVQAKFTTANATSVTCDLGIFVGPVPCTLDGVNFNAPDSDLYSTLLVTVTGPGGSASASVALHIDGSPLLPEHVSALAGSKVSVPLGSLWRYYSSWAVLNAQPFSGPLADVGFKREGNAVSLTFTAPSKPGTYVETLRLYVGEKSTMTVDVFAADEGDTSKAVGGAESKTAPLSCPKGSSGSTYSWYINDKLVSTSDSNLLAASAVPKNGTVMCMVNDPKGGAPAPVKVLVDNGNRLALTAGAKGVDVTVSAKTEVVGTIESAAPAQGSAAAGKKHFRPVTKFTQTLKQGKNKVKLAKQMPKWGYRITIRIKRKSGRLSKPLVLSRA